MASIARKRLGLLLSGIIIPLVLFIGIFELAANIRYYRWKKTFDNYGWFERITVPSENPVLMWEYRSYGKIGEIETNRYGFRDCDYESTTKPDGALRIAFVGDSVTLGMGVDFEETFVHQFEVEANRVDSRHRIQALNFSVDGYDTRQICEMVRTKVLDFDPDRVVYIMCMNDFDFMHSSGEKARYFKKPKCFFLLRVEAFYQKWLGGDFHLYHFRRNKNAVFQCIIKMKEMLKREGSSLQIVLLPVFPPGATDFRDYPLRAVHSEIAECLKRNGIRFFDLLEAFAASTETPEYYASDIWHLNSEGHRFIAEQLVSSILSDQLIAGMQQLR